MRCVDRWLVTKSTMLLWVCSMAGAAPPEMTSYQITPDHAGVTSSGGTLALQETPLWSVTLPGAASYPIIAGGLVFVTVGALPGHVYGTQLFALDANTGAVRWGPVDFPATYLWSNAAYDTGKLFVLDYNGNLRSFDAASGTPGWSVSLGTYNFQSPPTASNGVIYVSGNGALQALDETNGAQLWLQGVTNGDNSSPAVGPGGVYVSYACPNVFGFSLTGGFQWQFPNPLVCSGGGGKTAAYGGGLLYARDSWNSGFVLDAATGLQVATFPGGTIPAVAPGAVFYNNLGTLRSVDPATRAVNWSFSGDGQLVTAPIVVDEAVIVGSATGNLYAVDTLTGSANWQVKVASFLPAPDEQNVSQPLTGLGIADGLLVVPAGSTLSAYQIFGPPAATALVATSGAGSVNLSWSAAASADTYNVYMAGASRTEAPVPILSGVRASATVVPNLIAGTRYYFRVKAVSAAGISAPSNEVSAVPHNPSPASGLAATADIASATLAWTASPEARTYSIYQGTSSGGEAAVPVLTNVVATTVKIANLTIGTPYYFFVKAEAYGSLSTASNEASATPLPPPAPTGVQAKSGDGSVTLSWSAAAGAASYDVYRGTSAAGESSMPVLQGVSALTATVTGLTNGTTYFFYVRSQTPQGASDPSVEVSARPAAPPPASSGSGGGGVMGSRETIGLLLLLALQMATQRRERAADRQAS